MYEENELEQIRLKKNSSYAGYYRKRTKHSLANSQ